MAQEAIAIRAPTGVEVTEAVTSMGAAGITGLVEGLIVRVAPRMGAAASVLTWGALFGVPIVGAFGSLFTRGMLGQACKGIAGAGFGVLGYSIPELISPTARRVRTPTSQLGAGSPVKELTAGAAQRAQQAVRARSTVEF